MPIPKVKSKKETDFFKKNTLVYGIAKAGKSTFVTRITENYKALWFTTEPGHKELEILKWQTDKGEDPTNWEHFRLCVKELTEQNEIKCLIVDTADNLFSWCEKYVNKKHNLEHSSDAGYGKGYSLVKDEFHTVINYLTQKNFGVFFISHSHTQDKELVNKKITYTDSTLPNTAKKVVHALVDHILYVYVDIDGKRYIRTKGTETVNAGDRSGRLPDVMPLDHEIFLNEINKNQNQQGDKQ